MKESTKRIRKMGLVNFIGLTVECIKENGKMDYSMELEYIERLKEKKN